MCMKTQVLSGNSGIGLKLYVADTKSFIELGRARQWERKNDAKMKVYPRMLLKTKIEKISTWGYPRMFMQTNDLIGLGQNVNENKWLAGRIPQYDENKSTWLKSEAENGGQSPKTALVLPQLSVSAIRRSARQASLGVALLLVGGAATTQMHSGAARNGETPAVGLKPYPSEGRK